jgi:hypothetical protein
MFTTGGNQLQSASLDRESIRQSGQDSLKRKINERQPPPVNRLERMKNLILTITALATLFAATISSYGQGNVVFANNSLSINKIYDSYGRATFGTNTFRFGLYMGPQGSDEAQLVLVATAVNAPSASSTSPTAGVFNGGNPFTLPAQYQAGTTYAFQIRAWTYADGLSYEAAINSGDSGLEAGTSLLGYVVPTSTPLGAAPLFGTSAGQISGFQMPIIPEPTTLALGGLGAAGLLFFRRRK